MFSNRCSIFAVAAILALSLCACGSSDTAEQPLSSFTPEQVSYVFQEKVMEDPLAVEYEGLTFAAGEYLEDGSFQVAIHEQVKGTTGALTIHTNDAGAITKAELTGVGSIVIQVEPLFYALDLDADFADYVYNTFAATNGESQDWERDGIHVYYECDDSGYNQTLSVYRE